MRKTRKHKVVVTTAITVLLILGSCKKEIATEPVIDKSLNPVFVSVTVDTQTSSTVKVK